MSTPLFEARVQPLLAGFELTFLEIPYVSSHLSCRLGRKAL